MLRSFQNELSEAGVDEAGRGCLAGPVCAAAVILPPGFNHPYLNDSKKVSHLKREILRRYIEENARFGVAFVHPEEIDRINILQAAIRAMHLALDQLDPGPDFVAVDGNYFKPYQSVPYSTIIKGDAKISSIAAASILAKTYRDEYMMELHRQHPGYCWHRNKGYPTKEHRRAIKLYGVSEYHRLSFRLSSIEPG